MKKILLIFLLSLCLTWELFSQEQPKETPFDSFMGMKWGIDQKIFKKEFPNEVRNTKSGFIMTDFKLGDILLKGVIFIFKEDKFDTVVIVLDSDDFPSLYKVFETKYGKPSEVKESTIQNRMGTKFNQIKARWFTEKRIITIDRFGSKITESFVQFIPASAIEDFKKENKKSTEKAADQL